MKKLFLSLMAVLATSSLWADDITVGISATIDDAAKTISAESYDGYKDGSADIITNSGAVYGAGITAYAPTGSSKSVQVNGTSYAINTHWRKSINSSSYDDTQWAGCNLTIADGYMFNVTSAHARIAVNDDTYTWKVVVMDASDVVVYESKDKTTKKTSTTDFVVDFTSDEMAETLAKMTGLTGTIKLRIYMYQGGSFKYFTIPNLQLTGTVTVDTRAKYAMTTSASPAEGGTVSPASGTTIVEGGTATFTATPATGYKFGSWLIDDVEQTSNPYQITNVTAAHTAVANFIALPAITYSNGGDAEVMGTLPTTEYVESGGSYTIPTAYFLYKSGYYLAGWTDGTNTYKAGESVTITGDLALTPVYTANAKALGEFEAEVVWNFGESDATTIQIEGAEGCLVKQVTAGDVTYDFVLGINAKDGAYQEGVRGKFNNAGKASNAQVNKGTVFTVPAVKGMQVIYTYTTGTPTVDQMLVDGVAADSVSETNKQIYYTYKGDAASVSVVDALGDIYPSSLAVKYPVAESGNGGSTTTAEDIVLDLASGAVIDKELATAVTGKEVASIKINLAKGGEYSISGGLTTGVNFAIYGDSSVINIPESVTGDFITLNGSSVYAIKSDLTESDHFQMDEVILSGIILNGLQGSLITDAQKTKLDSLAISNSVIAVAANSANVVNFNGKGYVGAVMVENSTIYAPAAKSSFFAQYGSRPKNVNGDLTQAFYFHNSTIVNIANGKNFNDLKQKGTAQNVFSVKNSIFVDCGKQNQVLVGLDGGQASTTPQWTVEGNIFNYGGADVSAAETEKAGIETSSVAAVVTFADSAVFDADLVITGAVVDPLSVGDPRWSLSAAYNVVLDLASGAVIDKELATAVDGLNVAGVTINLAKGGEYSISGGLTTGVNFAIYGDSSIINIPDTVSASFITLNGSSVYAIKSDLTASDHFQMDEVILSGIVLNGLQGSLITDAQKTKLDSLAISNSVIAVAANSANVVNFNGKGYVGAVMVENSTIYAPAAKSSFFAQYGSRPKNVNGDLTQAFYFHNSTIVNIANGKNFNDLKQKGTAQNVFSVKNSIFVDCGKQNQVLVGLDGGQASTTPQWTVEGNIFNYGGADVSAAETEKAGIETSSVAAVVTFVDAAAGNMNATLTVAEGVTVPESIGDPRWTISTEVSGIDNVVADDVQKDGKFFINGKLVIVRNGQMFNANGQLIK